VDYSAELGAEGIEVAAVGGHPLYEELFPDPLGTAEMRH